MLLALFLSAALGLQQAGTSVSADGRLSATYARCMDQAGGVTADMIDCSREEYGRQDAVLNATYRALMARLGTRERAELRTAQRAWIRAKEAGCDSKAAELGGGSLSTVVLNNCHLMATVERVGWLKSFAGEH